MKKTLDKKIKNIINGNYKYDDFIIADAKDADMGGGIPAPGNKRDKSGKLFNEYKNLDSYLKSIESITRSKLVDIMLMSASNAERLVQKGLFKNSTVTPAVRMNDTSDIWGIRHGEYQKEIALPFRTARVKTIKKIANLGLFSITFSKNLKFDLDMLNAYRNFREEAVQNNFDYFLEVFNPQTKTGLSQIQLGEYINDCILKTLAGQVRNERPLFLKIAYNGPKAMEELASYDPGNLIVGILGGGKGTTRDCFELISKSSKYGAKVALFGRKINLAEDQGSILKTMRHVIKGMSSIDGVKYYHDQLLKKKIKPDLLLDKDSKITEKVLKL
jgi:hypothetical protein